MSFDSSAMSASAATLGSSHQFATGRRLRGALAQNSASLPGYFALRGEVAGDIEDEVGGIVGVGVDFAVGGGHDRHVRGDGSVVSVQGRDIGLGLSVRPQ